MNFLIIEIVGGRQDKAKGPIASTNFPPLGLLYLGGALEIEGHKIEFIDFKMEKISKGKLKKSCIVS